MTHWTGHALYVSFGGTAITGDQRTFSKNEKIDKVDITAGDDDDRDYLTTIKDVTMAMTILDNSTAGSAVKSALAIGNAGTLLIGPEGTASGKPKYTCVAFVESNDTEYPYDGEVEFNVTFQRQGAWSAHYELLGSTW
jgi:hypothetical protein